MNIETHSPAERHRDRLLTTFAFHERALGTFARALAHYLSGPLRLDLFLLPSEQSGSAPSAPAISTERPNKYSRTNLHTRSEPTPAFSGSTSCYVG